MTLLVFHMLLQLFKQQLVVWLFSVQKIITSSLSSLFLYTSSYPVIWFSCPVCAGAIHESKMLVSDLASPLKSVGWEGTGKELKRLIKNSIRVSQLPLQSNSHRCHSDFSVNCTNQTVFQNNLSDISRKLVHCRHIADEQNLNNKTVQVLLA